MQGRSVGQYNFDNGYLRISVWGDISSSEALDMVEVLVDLERAELAKASQTTDCFSKPLRTRLKKAIGALRSIAYGDESTWPSCSSREVAKQGLLNCGGEKKSEQPSRESDNA